MAQGSNYNIVYPAVGVGNTVGTTVFTGQGVFPAGNTTAPGVAIGTTSTGWVWTGTTLMGVLNQKPVMFLTGTPISDGNLAFQANATASSPSYFAMNRGGAAYGALFGYDFAIDGGTLSAAVVRSVNAADSVVVVTNNSTLAAQWNPSGRVRQMRPETLLKGAGYTVVAADSFTVFENGTTSATVNTLPPVSTGLEYTFVTSLAGSITVTPNGSDTFATGAKTAGQSLSCTAAKGNVLKIVGGVTANTWLVVSNVNFT
jgi:hypothetical protein